MIVTSVISKIKATLFSKTSVNSHDYPIWFLIFNFRFVAHNIMNKTFPRSRNIFYKYRSMSFLFPSQNFRQTDFDFFSETREDGFLCLTANSVSSV